MDKLKAGLITVASVVVAGVVIAGATMGWPELLKSVTGIFTSAKIVASPVGRPEATDFLAGEKLWFIVKGQPTQRVYWLFDESDKVAAVGAQIQYTFQFDNNAPAGAKAYHRVDAFFKDDESERGRVLTFDICDWGASKLLGSEPLKLRN